MDVTNNNLVFSFIIGFHFPHAECDETSFTVCDELETTTFNNFTNTFVELERWWWITLNCYREVSSLICNALIIRKFFFVYTLVCLYIVFEVWSTFNSRVAFLYIYDDRWSLISNRLQRHWRLINEILEILNRRPSCVSRLSPLYH